LEGRWVRGSQDRRLRSPPRFKLSKGTGVERNSVINKKFAHSYPIKQGKGDIPRREVHKKIFNSLYLHKRINTLAEKGSGNNIQRTRGAKNALTADDSRERVFHF